MVERVRVEVVDVSDREVWGSSAGGVGEGNGDRGDIGGVDGGQRCFGNGFGVGVEGIGSVGCIGGIAEEAPVEVVGW